MSITPPEDYLYFTVTGRFLKTVMDGPDEDRHFDVVPATGTFNFAPRVQSYKNLSLPATFITTNQTATLDDEGYLQDHLNNPGVVLMSSLSPGISPSGWTWTVTMTVDGKQFPTFDIPSDIPPGTVVDLTTLMPAAPNPGTVTIVSDATKVAAEAAVADARAAANDAQGIVDTAPKWWTGTQAQYDAISPKRTDTLYLVVG